MTTVTVTVMMTRVEWMKTNGFLQCRRWNLLVFSGLPLLLGLGGGWVGGWGVGLKDQLEGDVDYGLPLPLLWREWLFSISLIYLSSLSLRTILRCCYITTETLGA